jgi:hypothetical protein
VVTVVNGHERTAEVTIIWEGGATTEFRMTRRPTGGHFRTTDEDTAELVHRLALHYDDRTIAVILSRQGRRTGSGLGFTTLRVKSLRQSRDIAPLLKHCHTPRS